MKIHHILVPVYFSAHSRAAVEVARECAGQFQARLTLLKVLEPIHVVFGELFPSEVLTGSERRARADTRMKELRDSLGGVVDGFVLEGTAWSTICDFAKDQKIDLIIIASHGYHGLKRAFLGSTAERVVRHAPCSVLIVKPPGTAPSA